MTIDAYNADLPLGAEYHGEQHFKHVPHYHLSEASFEHYKTMDQLKYDLCINHVETLMVIDYTTPHIDIRRKVRQVLDEDWGWPRDEIALMSNETDEEFYNRIKEEAYKELRDISKASGVEIRPQRYIEAQCSQGHQFHMLEHHLDPNTWCEVCIGSNAVVRSADEDKVANLPGYTIQRLFRARDKEGRLRKYVNFRCPHGHERQHVEFDNFLKRANGKTTSCGICAAATRNSDKRNDPHVEGAKIGVEFLNDFYKNNTTVYWWRCKAQGHVFQNNWDSLKQAGRCSRCKLQQACEERGFVMLDALDTHQINPTKQLLFKCLHHDKYFLMAPIAATGRKEYYCDVCQAEHHEEELAKKRKPKVQLTAEELAEKKAEQRARDNARRKAKYACLTSEAKESLNATKRENYRMKKQQ
jgi:hypothetical protein